MICLKSIIFIVNIFCRMKNSSTVQSQQSNQPYIHQLDKHQLVLVNQQYKCICQLCSCGRHRCPRPVLKGQFETSYNNHYKDTHIIIPTNSPPQYVYQDRHYNPQALRTNYKESFTDKPHIENAQMLSKSRLQNIGMSVLKPTVPFYGSSAYTQQFKPFTLQSNYNPQQDKFITQREKIPHYGFQSPAKFDDSTAYKQQFQAPSPAKNQKSPYPQHKIPDVPFQGSSSYKSQFKEYKLQPAYENYYNQSVTNAPKIKFQADTIYKNYFKGFSVMPNQNPSGTKCQLQRLNLPHHKFLESSSPHIDTAQRHDRYS